jgi:hypothetical protein
MEIMFPPHGHPWLPPREFFDIPLQGNFAKDTRIHARRHPRHDGTLTIIAGLSTTSSEP